jgi:hypothetical protein
MSIDHVEPDATPATVDAVAPAPAAKAEAQVTQLSAEATTVTRAGKPRAERGDHWYRRTVLRVDVLAIAIALGATLVVRFTISGELRHLDIAVASSSS